MTLESRRPQNTFGSNLGHLVMMLKLNPKGQQHFCPNSKCVYDNGMFFGTSQEYTQRNTAPRLTPVIFQVGTRVICTVIFLVISVALGSVRP